MTHRADGPSEQPQFQRSLGDQLASAVSIGEEETRPRTSGLPVARLLPCVHDSGMYFAVTKIDNRGRLADRSPIRVLGWSPNRSVTISVFNGLFIVVSRSHGPNTITRQGHLRLPADVRHSCRLAPGAQLLVAACPERDLLAAYTASALEAMLSAYTESVPNESRP